MLVLVEEEKRKRPTPTPSPPPQFLHSSPPLTPPREGRGGGCLHSIKLHAADSAPHAESTTFSRKFGVRAGDTERNTQYFKGTLTANTQI
jgi:hypothetical protein